MRNLYVVRDVVAEMYGPIMEAVNDDVAKRQFTQLLKQVFEKNDYVLVKIGNFDESNLKLVEDHEVIMDGKDVLIRSAE